jgi:hypothetical protein
VPGQAILFADICGSTRLYEHLGDEAAQRAVHDCLAFMAGIVEAEGGRVVRKIGDEILCAFAGADAAVAAACAIQRRNEGGALHGGQRLLLRIGLHFGEAQELPGDVAGEGVAVASRVADLAKATQVVTTGATVARLSPRWRSRARTFHRLALLDGEESRICEMVWDDAVVVEQSVAVERGGGRLAIAFGGRTFTLDERAAPDGSFSIGRGAHCDLLVAEPGASRTHCRLENRRGKFYLVDVSTNGTFVRFQDGQEVYLRREEVLLWGRGEVSLARSVRDSGQLIRFECLD